MAMVASSVLAAGNENWSRQFPKPKRLLEMGPGTGISSGHTKPTVTQAKWHEGRLWMAGAWEAGILAETGKQKPNQYWQLWTWSPVEGYEPIAYFSGKSGGAGPDGKILDFEFLPDGRLVVVGSFTRLGNPGGHRYHDVNAAAIYDPKLEDVNKWRPIGTVQYNGTVSEGGSIYSVEYDPQGGHLYLGGTFGGIRTGKGHPGSPFVHRVHLETGAFEPLTPGVRGAKPIIRRIFADTSTNPSTIWIAGKFHYTGGDGQNPAAGGTSRQSTGFAKWQEGKGWTRYPPDHPKNGADEDILQRAADFITFDSVNIRDFLIDGEDIWIVGAFSEGKAGGGPLRGIAKWDAAKQLWVDPTGKGGVGRDVFDIEKAANGKIYFAGAFGGNKTLTEGFQGFKDGTAVRMAMSFDPATGKWEQLGGGLRSLSFPEIQMAVNGNDIYFVGDFDGVHPVDGKQGIKAEIEIDSHLIARWNEDIDFSQDEDGSKASPPKPAPLPARAAAKVRPGNEFWSRGFPKPPRASGGKSKQSGKTGMDDGQGAPSQIAGMVWVGDTLYFAGNWQPTIKERWFVWSYHPENGWTKLAWEGRGTDAEGVTSPPSGIQHRDGKLYVYGPISKYAGIASYDIAGKKWEQVGGTYKGKPVEGNAVPQRGGPIHDIAWDEKTGDLYTVGSSGLGMEPHSSPPTMIGPVIKIAPDGTYTPMGKALMAEDPNKPVLTFNTIYLDQTKDPVDIYIGGTFHFYGGPPSHSSRMTYNIAKWDHEKSDWGPVGTNPGRWYSEHHKQYYPEGVPGLPAHPGDEFSGYLASIFAKVRDITMDKQGNLYAVGSVAVLDNSMPVKDRTESFGIAKLDATSKTWVPVHPDFAGFSRDPIQMTWLDDDTLLLSGGMDKTEDWKILNSVCTLNVRTGEVKNLGGGLMRPGRDQTVAAMVAHTVRGDELWFGGLFTRAGVNDNSTLEGPVQSQYVAMYHRSESQDPNAGLVVKPPEAVCAVTGSSSKGYKVTLEATAVPDGGTVTWYEKRSTGFGKKGSGPKYNANIRVKKGMSEVLFYVAVKTKDGMEGAPVPVRIPVKACP
jgi:hypothetical protein